MRWNNSKVHCCGILLHESKNSNFKCALAFKSLNLLKCLNLMNPFYDLKLQNSNFKCILAFKSLNLLKCLNLMNPSSRLNIDRIKMRLQLVSF